MAEGVGAVTVEQPTAFVTESGLEVAGPGGGAQARQVRQTLLETGWFYILQVLGSSCRAVTVTELSTFFGEELEEQSEPGGGAGQLEEHMVMAGGAGQAGSSTVAPLLTATVCSTQVTHPAPQVSQNPYHHWIHLVSLLLYVQPAGVPGLRAQLAVPRDQGVQPAPGGQGRPSQHHRLHWTDGVGEGAGEQETDGGRGGAGEQEAAGGGGGAGEQEAAGGGGGEELDRGAGDKGQVEGPALGSLVEGSQSRSTRNIV